MHVDEHADGLNPVVCKCLCHAKQLESTAETQRHIRALVWKASALGCCLGPGPSVKHVMMFGTVKRWFGNPDPTSARLTLKDHSVPANNQTISPWHRVGVEAKPTVSSSYNIPNRYCAIKDPSEQEHFSWTFKHLAHTINGPAVRKFDSS